VSTAAERRAAESGAGEAGAWLDMYRAMTTIRLFEEHVNDLYRGAKMPGLAHLYIGEEAVAVGVCSALRRDDYITSTHRGHGHCLAKGADVARMFASVRLSGLGRGGRVRFRPVALGLVGRGRRRPGRGGRPLDAGHRRPRRGAGTGDGGVEHPGDVRRLAAIEQPNP